MIWASHLTKVGRAWSGKIIPEISIRGREMIREKRTAMPSLFEMRPMMKPSRVLVSPTKRIS